MKIFLVWAKWETWGGWHDAVARVSPTGVRFPHSCGSTSSSSLDPSASVPCGAARNATSLLQDHSGMQISASTPG